MNQKHRSIPRPLVRANQWFIVICVVATWFSGQEWLLALPLLAGILGLFFKFNPVMQFAKLFLRKPLSEYIPEDWDQQRFNQIIAVIFLAIGLIGYLLDWMVIAYIFTAMVALAAFIAILGFCIGCFIRYHWIQYRNKKLLNES
jgi:hypothetical protein